MFLFYTLSVLTILKGYAFAPDVSVDCPGNFIHNVTRNVTGSLNSSVLTTGPTGNCVYGVTSVNFYFIKGSNAPDLLCTQTFSSSTDVCDQNFNAQGCRCDRHEGNMFYYVYQLTPNQPVQDGGFIQMKPNCLNASRQYPLVETLCNMTFETTTTATTATTTTIYSSETTNKGSTPRTSISHSITSTVSSSSVTNIASTSGTTDHSQSGTTVHFSSAATDHLPSSTTVKSMLSTIVPISNTSDYTAIIVGASYAGLVIVTSCIVIVFLKYR